MGAVPGHLGKWNFDNASDFPLTPVSSSASRFRFTGVNSFSLKGGIGPASLECSLYKLPEKDFCFCF